MVLLYNVDLASCHILMITICSYSRPSKFASPSVALHINGVNTVNTLPKSHPSYATSAATSQSSSMKYESYSIPSKTLSSSSAINTKTGECCSMQFWLPPDYVSV